MRELYVCENEVKIERRGERRIFYYTIGCSNRLERIPRRIKEEGFGIIRRVIKANGEVLEYGDVVTKDTITI